MAAAAPAAVQPAPLEAPHGYSYSAGGRRDPFVSLLRRGTTPNAVPGTRSPGLAGMSANDVSLRGVIATRDGFIAIVHAADDRTYIVRVGQKLLDGTIRSIGADSIVIAQRIVNSAATGQPRERELRKVLRPDGNK
jgi:Tfp pilus assembly protein PilP